MFLFGLFKCTVNMGDDQSYTSQVHTTYKHLKKRCSPKPFAQTKNGLVSGRLACTSSKTELLNKIGVYISILNFQVNLECLLIQKT